jgi:hypothetical protein
MHAVALSSEHSSVICDVVLDCWQQASFIQYLYANGVLSVVHGSKLPLWQI